MNSNVTITASETIRLVDNSAVTDANVGTLITLKDTDVNGAVIPSTATISGNVITINPTADFSSLQQVYVAINGAAVEDTSDNAGASANATFTTADTSAPTLTSSTPADDATGVAVGSNIVLTFSENIATGTGNIVVSDGSIDTRTIAIGDAQISVSGATLTINPTADLNSSTTYYVQIDATAVDDL
ncbi:Ig-like domain-containing protein, partial [Planktomarina temperata]|nr:Ig-like domain-containing protein [Planktomarina temperata]